VTAAVTNTALPNAASPLQGFDDYCDTCVEEAAFLWLLRSMAVTQPHYSPEDLLDLEERIDRQLTALQLYPDAAWLACQRALGVAQSGEVFVASVVAFKSLDVYKIQQAVEAGLENESVFKALVSALAWLPGRFCHPWVKKFFTSKEMAHKRLAVAVCLARREDPSGYLNRLLERDDCRQQADLHAQCLKAIGVFKRRDLLAYCEQALCDEDDALAFWAHWAAVLLGDRSAPMGLQRFALEAGPFQLKALTLAVRRVPPTLAKRWISDLLHAGHMRLAIQATAALGDPEALPWIIACMRDPSLARVSGEALTQMTGIDLEAHELCYRLPQIPFPEDANEPEERSDGEGLELDEDENLPWPNVEKIKALWETIKHRYPPGKRLFLGRELDNNHLRRHLNSGFQRHRAWAALELALREPGLPMPNVKNKQGPWS